MLDVLKIMAFKNFVGWFQVEYLRNQTKEETFCNLLEGLKLDVNGFLFAALVAE